MLALLSDEELAPLLAALPSWTRRGDALARTLRVPSLAEGTRLLARIALVADAHDHHPDFSYDAATASLTLVLSTHDAGGLTRRDTGLARALDPLLDAVAA
jgi:4a-hydroxytetrahydrobiopterin dehydratase